VSAGESPLVDKLTGSGAGCHSSWVTGRKIVVVCGSADSRSGHEPLGDSSARVHGYETVQLYCDCAFVPLGAVRGFGVCHHAARACSGRESSTTTCSAGMGAAGVSDTRTGAPTGRFSSAEQEFRNAHRGVPGSV
jgi:hypothetical protein